MSTETQETIKAINALMQKGNNLFTPFGNDDNNLKVNGERAASQVQTPQGVPKVKPLGSAAVLERSQNIPVVPGVAGITGGRSSPHGDRRDDVLVREGKVRGRARPQAGTAKGKASTTRGDATPNDAFHAEGARETRGANGETENLRSTIRSVFSEFLASGAAVGGTHSCDDTRTESDRKNGLSAVGQARDTGGPESSTIHVPRSEEARGVLGDGVLDAKQILQRLEKLERSSLRAGDTDVSARYENVYADAVSYAFYVVLFYLVNSLPHSYGLNIFLAVITAAQCYYGFVKPKALLAFVTTLPARLLGTAMSFVKAMTIIVLCWIALTRSLEPYFHEVIRIPSMEISIRYESLPRNTLPTAFTILLFLCLAVHYFTVKRSGVAIDDILAFQPEAPKLKLEGRITKRPDKSGDSSPSSVGVRVYHADATTTDGTGALLLLDLNDYTTYKSKVLVFTTALHVVEKAMRVEIFKRDATGKELVYEIKGAFFVPKRDGMHCDVAAWYLDPRVPLAVLQVSQSKLTKIPPLLTLCDFTGKTPRPIKIHKANSTAEGQIIASSGANGPYGVYHNCNTDVGDSGSMMTFMNRGVEYYLGTHVGYMEESSANFGYATAFAIGPLFLSLMGTADKPVAFTAKIPKQELKPQKLTPSTGAIHRKTYLPEGRGVMSQHHQKAEKDNVQAETKWDLTLKHENPQAEHNDVSTISGSEAAAAAAAEYLRKLTDAVIDAAAATGSTKDDSDAKAFKALQDLSHHYTSHYESVIDTVTETLNREAEATYKHYASKSNFKTLGYRAQQEAEEMEEETLNEDEQEKLKNIVQRDLRAIVETQSVSLRPLMQTAINANTWGNPENIQRLLGTLQELDEEITERVESAVSFVIETNREHMNARFPMYEPPEHELLEDPEEGDTWGNMVVESAPPIADFQVFEDKRINFCAVTERIALSGFNVVAVASVKGLYTAPADTPMPVKAYQQPEITGEYVYPPPDKDGQIVAHAMRVHSEQSLSALERQKAINHWGPGSEQLHEKALNALVSHYRPRFEQAEQITSFDSLMASVDYVIANLDSSTSAGYNWYNYRNNGVFKTHYKTNEKLRNLVREQMKLLYDYYSEAPVVSARLDTTEDDHIHLVNGLLNRKLIGLNKVMVKEEPHKADKVRSARWRIIVICPVEHRIFQQALLHSLNKSLECLYLKSLETMTNETLTGAYTDFCKPTPFTTDKLGYSTDASGWDANLVGIENHRKTQIVAALVNITAGPLAARMYASHKSHSTQYAAFVDKVGRVYTHSGGLAGQYPTQHSGAYDTTIGNSLYRNYLNVLSALLTNKPVNDLPSLTVSNGDDNLCSFDNGDILSDISAIEFVAESEPEFCSRLPIDEGRRGWFLLPKAKHLVRFKRMNARLQYTTFQQYYELFRFSILDTFDKKWPEQTKSIDQMVGDMICSSESGKKMQEYINYRPPDYEIGDTVDGVVELESRPASDSRHLWFLFFLLLAILLAVVAVVPPDQMSSLLDEAKASAIRHLERIVRPRIKYGPENFIGPVDLERTPFGPENFIGPLLQPISCFVTRLITDGNGGTAVFDVPCSQSSIGAAMVAGI